MYISYLYVQTVTHQCFCFPNSQWGATAHDTTVVLSTAMEDNRDRRRDECASDDEPH